MWKSDLSRVYRQLCIDPLDYPLLGIKYDNNYFVDICPSFGCRTSGQAQQRVSNAVVYLMHKDEFPTLAYVDDFCGISPSLQDATRSYERFHSLTSELGFKLAPDETEPPSTTLEWLGFLFNTNDMSITVPQQKLDDVLEETARWQHRDTATRQQIQSLAGKLNHFSMCVRPARRFMGRILATLRASHNQDPIVLDDDFKLDISWFSEYARLTNRRLLIEPRLPSLTIECDACITCAGGFSPTDYYSCPFPSDYASNFHITQLEAINLVLAIKTLVPKNTRNMRICVKTDNMGSKFALSTGKTKDPILGACAREIWLISAVQELDILVTHAPGESLILADALSRATINPRLKSIARALVCQKKLSCVIPVPLHDVLTMCI